MKKQITTGIVIFSISTLGLAQNTGIGTTTPLYRLDVVSAAATSNNATIYATNTGNTGNALLGESNAIGTYGLRGASLSGTGVQGYTNTGYALTGAAISGTGIFAQSSMGYGLTTAGKLRFSGGNMNPSDGALLTSDANGNASWKAYGVAFSAHGAANAISGTFTKVEFSNEAFDTKNSFAKNTGSVSAGSSVFTAPVSGVYHFSAAVVFEKTGFSSTSNYMLNGTIDLIKNGSSINYNIAPYISHLNAGGNFSCYVYLYLDTDVHLNANDKVWVQAYNRQNKDHAAAPVPLNGASFNTRFNGTLIFAD